MKTFKESFVEAPWGKIALISWGNPRGEPVMLVHGMSDSASTFIPLMELLPDSYNYVALDIPGHGKSDPFPTGVILMNFYIVQAIVETVNKLGWDKFIFITHSAGAICLLYNLIFANRVQKYILIDPGISFLEELSFVYPLHFQLFQAKFYEEFDENNYEAKIYSKRKILDRVMKARNLTEEQAEVVLLRNLTYIGDDKYKTSWDRRTKLIMPFIVSNELIKDFVCGRNPPTLVINATRSHILTKEMRKISNEFLADLEKNNRGVHTVVVEGAHDVHLTNPERIGPYISSFLVKGKVESIAKL